MREDWRKLRGLWVSAAVGLAVALAPGNARAQFGLIGGPPAAASGGSSATGSAPMLSNFLMNPYMNPLINPYAGQQATATSNSDMALYMLAATSMYSGIGSGRISGTRPGPAGQGEGKPAAARPHNAANTPGGNASRYFNRAYAGAAYAGVTPPKHRESPYNRSSRYYPQTGK
jgi:hypothetical protein